MELGDKERDGGLPNYFGAQEFTFFGLQTFLEHKNLHFSVSKLFWSTRIYNFWSPNFFGTQRITFFGTHFDSLTSIPPQTSRNLRHLHKPLS